MKISKTTCVSIDTERLLLRQFKASDSRDAFNNFLSDSTVDKFLDWNAHKRVFESLKYCYEMSKKLDCWAIVLKETNQVIGFIGSRKQQGILTVGDSPSENVYDVGYGIGSKWWGIGIVPEAAKAVVNYQFNENNVDIVIAMHHIENGNSGKVMEKIGMQYVKNVFRPYCKDKSKIVENCMYKITK